MKTLIDKIKNSGITLENINNVISMVKYSELKTIAINSSIVKKANVDSYTKIELIEKVKYTVIRILEQNGFVINL